VRPASSGSSQAASPAETAPLVRPFDGYLAARRGTYRIIYRINEGKNTGEIHSIRHRRDAYHT
jgi:mRNA interferase RelE/StbE